MRSLIPWRRGEMQREPGQALTDFRREFDDLFNSFFGDQWWSPERYFGRRFVPAFDVSETEGELIVKAELPGVDPKEVDVSLTGNMLTIKGEKKEEREEKGENVHRMERSYGGFSRSFTLPCEVQGDKVEATYKDGVLNLRLPKAESSKTKSIKVKVQ